MLTKHVSRELSAYCHEELSAEESRLVAEHLIGCPRCRLKFEEIKLGIRLAGQLPVMPAPASLWSEIEAVLEKQPARNLSNRPYHSLLKPRLTAIAAGLVVLLLGGVLLLRFYRNESRPSWEVARVDGAPQIGSTRIGDKGKLAVGQWLETDSSSRAEIDVGSIGQVQIDPNTRVRLVETRPTEHRLELARGRLSARISAPPRLFFVNTPSAVAEDLGCAYTLEVDDDGNSLLRVTLGWVSLQLQGRESMVPADAACATRAGIGPGTPYFEDASETFRQALSQVDFGPNSTVSGNATPLEIVLANARVRDTLTLWHLLARVQAGDRELVYDRMASLVSPPDGVTRAGVLALNQQMLDSWKERLESRWDETSAPAPLKDGTVWPGRK